MLLRLPLWLLPGPGRDEAAYHYWAHHPEPAYAPALQLAVRLFEWPFGESLWALRMPVMLAGVLVLFLVHLRTRSAPESTRLLILFALALSPWQAFTGSILHPDTFFMVALLGFLLAARSGLVLTTAAAGVAMVLAKPVGALLIPAVWWALGRIGTAGVRRWISRGVLLLALLVESWMVFPELVSGMFTFGRLPGSILERMGAGAASLLFQGGPLLLWLGVWGARERWRTWRRGTDEAERDDAERCLVCAAVLLAFFACAALFRGQFKGNWVLPAVVVLLPAYAVRVPRMLVAAGVAFGILACAGQAAVLMRPEWVQRAGVDRWSRHVAQYGDPSSVSTDVMHLVGTGDGEEGCPPWIVSADYGLAASLHWILAEPDRRIVVPEHGVYHRTVESFRATGDAADVLVATRTRVLPDAIGSVVRVTDTLGAIVHPGTGDTLWLYRGSGTPEAARGH